MSVFEAVVLYVVNIYTTAQILPLLSASIQMANFPQTF